MNGGGTIIGEFIRGLKNSCGIVGVEKQGFRIEFCDFISV